MKVISPAIAAVIVLSTFAVANADDYSVSRSAEVADPEAAWNAVGDYCDLDDWHPAMSSCALKARDGSVHRLLVLSDGSEILEKLIAVEHGLSYTYNIVESPFPMTGFTATFSITRGDPSVVTWAARFSSDDPGMEATVGEFFEAGLAEITARFGG